MAKITRFNGNLVAPASASLGTERTLFGDVTQSDDLTDQFTADLLRGWGIVGPSDQPTLQDFNAMSFTLGQIHAYLHQMGVAEYDAAQEYHTGSFANVAGVLYVSLIDTNVGNAPASSPAQWRESGALLDSTRIDVVSATTVDLTTAAPNTRHINITGTTTINGFTAVAGVTYFVRFNAALTLTNSASLVTQKGANILTAAGDTCIIRATATNVVEILCYVGAAQGQVIHVRDQKAAGTDGGTFTSGAWRTRDLNTTLTNTIAGASLSANRVTLPAGAYEVFASAPANNVPFHQARIYNITSASTILNGSSMRSGAPGIHSPSVVIGVFTLDVSASIELQHAASTTSTTVGFGSGDTLGGLKAFEVYADMIIRRIS